MYRICTVCLLMALFAMAGCNKADSKKAPAAGAGANPAAASDNASEPPGAGLVVAEIGGSGNGLIDGELPPLPVEDVQFIHDELIRLAPEHDFAYDEEANVFTAPWLREEGIELAMLAEQVEMEGRILNTMEVAGGESGQIVTHEALTKWCAGIFIELQPQENPKNQARPARQKKQQRQSSGGAGKASPEETPEVTASANSTLVFASDAIGEWKSIREDHPRITTYHNDDYFQFFRFMHDGLAELKYFRDKKMVLIKQFTFEYSPRSGKISLYDSSKKLVETLILKMEPGNDDVLFIEFPGEDSTTVYERLGTGYPQPPEEEANAIGDGG